jgi:ADP-ribosyl-[dinitrogen reductase] hydrolase
VVGDVILHGKQELWQRKNVHYHAGLRAGENTLNAQLLRVLLRTSSDGDGYSPLAWLEAYAKFMTTEGSHNDSYADTAHVQFFYRFSQGTPLEECSGDENHSTANIGALYALVVLLLASAPGAAAGVEAGGTEAEAAEQVLAAVGSHVALTHRSPKLLRYASLLATLLLELLGGTPLRAALRTAGAELGIDLAAVAAITPPADGQLPPAFSDLPLVAKGFGLSCYVHDSLPAVLYLAYKYSEPSQAPRALLANTNVGGNTVHRGSISRGRVCH